ncbi:ABC transporter related [Thermotoga neapolitana DSM 4359]
MLALHGGESMSRLEVKNLTKIFSLGFFFKTSCRSGEKRLLRGERKGNSVPCWRKWIRKDNNCEDDFEAPSSHIWRNTVRGKRHLEGSQR